jgi:hypothetical protein
MPARFAAFSIVFRSAAVNRTCSGELRTSLAFFVGLPVFMPKQITALRGAVNTYCFTQSISVNKENAEGEAREKRCVFYAAMAHRGAV